MSFLNTFLEGQDYVAGENMTLADLAIVATVSTIEVISLKILSYQRKKEKNNPIYICKVITT